MFQNRSRYSSVTSKENPNIFPGLGSHVAYRNQESGDYFRGRVDDCMIPEGKCRIFNVDLGFEVEVKRNHIFKLSPYFAQIPPLAIECSLTGIQPLNSIKWSHESLWVKTFGICFNLIGIWILFYFFFREFFKEWVQDKVLCAHIMYG